MADMPKYLGPSRLEIVTAVSAAAEQVRSFVNVSSSEAKTDILNWVVELLAGCQQVKKARFHNVDASDLFTYLKEPYQDKVKQLNQKHGMTARNKTVDKVARPVFVHAFLIIKDDFSRQAQGNSAPRKMPTQVGIQGQKKATRSGYGPPAPATQSTTLHRGDYEKK